MTYQLSSTDIIIRHNDDGTTSFIPNDPLNTDRIEYEAWVDLGHTPDEAE